MPDDLGSTIADHLKDWVDDLRLATANADAGADAAEGRRESR